MTTDNSADRTPDAEMLRDAMRTVIDPEAGMNIVDLGLVYRVAVAAAAVEVDVTMTSAACPLGEMIVDEIRSALAAALPAGCRCEVRLVWSPPWSPSLMSEKARRHFGWQP